MKTLKSVISLLCVTTLIISLTMPSFAESDSYNGDINNISYVTPVYNQGDEAECIYYALLSTAGSYCMKHYNESAFEADFCGDEELFKNNLDLKESEQMSFNNIIEKSNGSKFSEKEEFYYISSAEIIDSPTSDIVKSYIISYGAVVLVYSASEGAANHAVSVVGWDAGKGWLCKDSYGEEYGEKGFHYISFNQDILSAAILTVAFCNKDGVVSITLPEDASKQRIDYVVAMHSGGGFKSAKAYTNDGVEFDCSFYRDYSTGYYAIRPSENYYFDRYTTIIYNGEQLSYGIDDSNGIQYEYSNGDLLIQAKEKGGFKITEIQHSMFGIEYIKLIYDDGSVKRITKGSYNTKGIEVNEYKDDLENFPYKADFKELPNKNQYYVVARFDEYYEFGLSNGSEYKVYPLEDGIGTEIVFIADELTAGVILEEIINFFFSIFTMGSGSALKNLIDLIVR